MFKKNHGGISGGRGFLNKVGSGLFVTLGPQNTYEIDRHGGGGGVQNCADYGCWQGVVLRIRDVYPGS